MANISFYFIYTCGDKRSNVIVDTAVTLCCVAVMTHTLTHTHLCVCCGDNLQMLVPTDVASLTPPLPLQLDLHWSMIVFWRLERVQ